MPVATPPWVTADRRRTGPPLRSAVGWLPALMEVLLLGLVCLAPWAFGAREPEFELVLFVGVAVLVVLGAVCGLLQGQGWGRWLRCPVSLGLLALLLVGVVQVVPLPPVLLARLAPSTVR